MSFKSKPLKKTPKKNVPVLPSVRLYRRIAAGFLSVTAILLIVVLYLATVQATIHVKTQEEAVSREFVVRVATEPQASEDVPGAVFVVTKEESRTFETEGEGEEMPAKANGIVTIFNDSSISQPLIATTRLLSETGVLFRIVEGVTVPANGSVQVEARADLEGKDGEIGPSRFTIPGLNAAKQEVIYATSEQAMTGGSVLRKEITLEDLDKAQTTLADELETELDTQWREQISGQLDGVTILREVLDKRSDTEPGNEVGTFTISTIIRFTGIYYDSLRLQQIAELKLQEHVPSGQVLTHVNTEEMVVAHNRHDADNGTAHFDVTVPGVAVLKATADILNKENLIGLTAAEAESFLEKNETIRDAQVELKPFWVHKIPKLKDHITIDILQE
ncbi:hypothetical protein COV06_04525 [Candidatus Uhrbacteria bacterium CG10_big_fil_rev_8_21_14_0_10_50_16]|uniref:Baseplate protein J-like domain-containing protein n=1 Tax=Candidatus Uhrbacteria bacterium CG10_big_fil_rev_8_21_14_0_10_50_16 TaxID=1975039 RepID=A0A2H0RLE4_9BACT|nr:MAG: hypothetical protein COV06_04525 [Candidatus Uhrbacteria bacterium CG10_big_fil_rev_8_21_14_0_10_50_16]